LITIVGSHNSLTVGLPPRGWFDPNIELLEKLQGQLDNHDSIYIYTYDTYKPWLVC
jgi:hypothetical protein